MRKKVIPFLSSISVRLLGFNILLVFLPIAGFLYLNTYEKQLLIALEHSLVQQGRMLSASLSGCEELSKEEAIRILKALKQKHEARLRVVDKSGLLLADSSRLSFIEPDAFVSPERIPESGEARQSFLYRIATFPVKLYRRFLKPPEPPFASGEFYSNTDTLTGSEIQAALEGKYGSATRISSGGQRSVTLYCAIPIRGGENFGDNVIGAALVSQSTYRILRDLYLLRLDVFKVLLICVAAAAALSLLVSMTIAYPVRYLSRQAEKILDHSGRLKGRFHDFKRRDEIGDLSRTLKELTQRLEEHMHFVESFASDVTHEFKNPLASIRSATEICRLAKPDEQARFFSMIQQDVSRMEHLLSGVREISIIDARLDQEHRLRIHINAFVEKILEGYAQKSECGIRFRVKISTESLYVAVSRERFAQVFENILDNAVSFSEKNGLIEVHLGRNGECVDLCICDNGPGIPDQNLGRIFNRFFSYRPGIEAEKNEEDHTGLGLSIARAIVEAYGGSIAARNRKTQGSCFVIKLPLVE